jgi:hypothetical protein
LNRSRTFKLSRFEIHLSDHDDWANARYTWQVSGMAAAPT